MKGTVTVQAAAVDDTGGSGDTGSTDTTTPTDSQADDGPALPATGMDVGGLALLGLMTLVSGRIPAPPHGAQSGPAVSCLEPRARANLPARERPQDPRCGGQARPGRA